MDPFDIDAISSALVKASLNPALWGQGLETGASATGSYGCVLLPVMGHLPLVSGTGSMERSLNAYIDGGWFDRDERYRAKAKFLRDGIATDDDCVQRDHRKQSPFYQDFIAKCGLGDWAGVRMGRGAKVWNLSLQRSTRQEPFSEDELSCLGRLSERLDAVVEVASALALSHGEASLDAFQFSGRAAFLVDRSGSAVRANQAAETLIGPNVTVSGGRIRSFDSKATDRLHLALRELLWTQTSTVVPPVVFPKTDGGRLIIYLMRTKGLTESPLAAFHAILVIADPEAEQSLTVQSMKLLFNLTPAETRLATAILNGQEIASFATSAGLSKETVRNQLKSIFGKTGTRRQPELTALLGNLIPDR